MKPYSKVEECQGERNICLVLSPSTWREDVWEEARWRKHLAVEPFIHSAFKVHKVGSCLFSYLLLEVATWGMYCFHPRFQWRESGSDLVIELALTSVNFVQYDCEKCVVLQALGLQKRNEQKATPATLLPVPPCPTTGGHSLLELHRSGMTGLKALCSGGLTLPST